MNKSDFLKHLRELVGEGCTEEALDFLETHFKDFSTYILNDVIILRSQFVTSKNQFLLKGIIENAEFGRSSARVNCAILEIADKIEKNIVRTKKKIVKDYSEEHKQLDKELFSKIKTKILPVSGSISFIRTNNFAGFAFLKKNIKDLYLFCQNIEKPDFEFIDKDLNIYLEQLKFEISKFYSLIGFNTWPIDNPNIDANTVPPEWEYEQPERFWKVVNEIHSTAEEICKNYDALIKLGKRKLGI